MENLRERLIEETRRQLFENGYESLNIRTIAKSCHIAVGTVYNYFPSKDMLAANVVLADWQQVAEKMRQSAESCTDTLDGIGAIYGLLLSFHDLYRKIFKESALSPLGPAFRERHTLLCTKIAEFIGLTIDASQQTSDAFLCVFLAESLLVASNEQWSFELLAPLLQKLIN